MVKAGRVAPVPKGDWNGTTAYDMLDIVTYNNASWIAKRESLGQTPQDGAYWQVFGGVVPIATTSVAGKVKPDGSTILVDVDGKIYVHVNIEDLEDVSITNLQPNQVLKWNGTAWVNSADTGGLLPHIVIISDTGSTVTLTKGTTVISAPETSTGHFEADVPEFGTWMIDAVLAGDDAQLSLVVDTVKVYTVDDSHFHADITVTFPSGSTCSCGKAGETPTYATTSPHTFTVHSTGVYTVSATDGTSTATDTVTITTNGQTESVTLSFVPNGATVVPTDDIQTWLHCGNIWNKSYTTLAEVLSDSTTLLALMSDNNAVDYMVRSKTWISANGLVPTMTDNTHPSGVASATNIRNASYDAYCAFDNNGASGCQPQDGKYAPWEVVYEFANPISAPKSLYYKIYWTYQFINVASSIQVLNSITNEWETLISINGTQENSSTSEATVPLSLTGTYSKIRYRLTAGGNLDGSQIYGLLVNELQLYTAEGITDNSTAMTDIGANNYCANTLLADADWNLAIASSQYIDSVENVKAPTMTGNTTPSGQCFADSEYSGHPAWHAFDNNSSTYFASNSSATSGVYIGYRFPSAKKIKTAIWKRPDLGGTDSVTFKVQHSSDGTTWTDVKEATSTTQTCVVPLETVSTSDDYWRLYQTGGAGTRMGADVIQFYGREDI